MNYPILEVICGKKGRKGTMGKKLFLPFLTKIYVFKERLKVGVTIQRMWFNSDSWSNYFLFLCNLFGGCEAPLNNGALSLVSARPGLSLSAT